ncbi:MAG: phosphatase domain-containing protein, partial [Pseudobdellovibrionaceae bacterium]
MKIVLLIFLFFYSFSSQGKTLLVSDIDDTIKLAHVRDFADALKYARDTESRFLGMNALYSKILQDQPDSQIVYLSKAPAWAMEKTHRRFLEAGGYPSGEYIPRTKYDEDVHKIKSLRTLLEEIKPEKVILVGDNGEQDADVYDQIAKEYSNRGIEFYHFIHIVYSRHAYVERGATLHPGQIGFVSPIEMALELEKKGIITFSSAQELIDNLIPEILKQKFTESEGIVAIP